MSLIKKNYLFVIYALFLNSISLLGQTPYYKWAYGFSVVDGSYSTDVKVNDKGDVFVAGNLSGPVDFDPTASSVVITPTGTDAFLAKYDENKNLMWAAPFLSAPAGNININSVFLEGNNYVYIVGDFSHTLDADPSSTSTFNLTANPTGDNSDIFIIKLSQSGQFIWAKSLGGSGYDKGASVCKDAGGNMYLTGIFQSSMDSNPGTGINTLTSAGTDDIFVLKLDGAGNFIWSFSLGSSPSETSVKIFNIENQLLLFGTFSGTVDFNPGPAVNNLSSNSGVITPFLTKYDLNSNFLKAEQIQVISGIVGLSDVSLSPSKDIYFTGDFNSQFDADPSAGSSLLTTVASNNGYIVKFDSAFNYKWAISTSTVPFSYANCFFRGVDVDSLNNVYAVGAISQTVDLDPGSTTYNVTAVAQNAGVVCRYGPAGEFIGGFLLDYNNSSSYNYQSANKVAADKNQNFYVAGSLWGNVDFDPGAGTSILSTPSFRNIGYIAKYGNCLGINSVVNATICHGAQYNLGGQNYKETGIYSHTFYTLTGCDSIVTLNLTVKHVNTDLTLTTTSIKSLASLPATFQWINCTTSSAVGVTSNTFSPADNNFYSVAVTQNGCTDTSACENIFSNANSGVPDIAWAAKTQNTNWGTNRFLKTDQYGNFYVTGSFTGTMDIDLQSTTKTISSSGNSPDIFLTKYDNNGLWKWSFPIGSTGTSANFDQGDCIYIDAQQNIYLTGTFEGTTDFDPGAGVFNLTSHGSWDVFFAKYNSNGQFLWAKSFGGNGDTYPVSLTMDKNSNIYLSGVYTATTDFDPGSSVYNLTQISSTSTQLNSGFIAKYDNSGNLIFAYPIGKCDNGVGDGPSLILDRSGNIIVSGTFDATFDFNLQAGTFNLTASPTGGSDIYIAKYSPTMTLLWAKKFGAAAADQIYSLTGDSDNNIYLLGNCSGNIDFSGGSGTAVSNNVNDFIAKYDSLGVFKLKYPLVATGTSTSVQSIILDEYKNLYVGGSYFFDFNSGSGNVTSMGQTDGFVAKYNNNGTIQWGFSIASSSEDEVNGIAIDNAGNVFIAGTFGNTVDFDPAASTYTMSTAINRQPFIAKYGQDCGAINTGSSTSGSTFIALAANSYYEWVNCNTNQVVAYTTTNSYTPSVSGNYKAIIHQGNCTDSTSCRAVITGIVEENLNPMLLFPNPATSYLNMIIDKRSSGIKSVQCIDIAGRRSQSKIVEIKSNEIKISINELNEGIYFVEVLTDSDVLYRAKFIKYNEK